LPFTIKASGGCERARKEISRFAARARRDVNVQNEIRFDVYDKQARIFNRRGYVQPAFLYGIILPWIDA